jgi:hypothetical protein
MFCPACGAAISQQTKYCRQCGAPLAVNDEAADARFDEYLTDIFWVSLFGLGAIVGGAAVLKGLHLSQGIVIGYLALSTAVFLIQFGLHLWEIFRLRGIVGKAIPPPVGTLDPNDTNKLKPTREPQALAPAHELGSVVEETTRTFEAAKESVAR